MPFGACTQIAVNTVNTVEMLHSTKQILKYDGIGLITCCPLWISLKHVFSHACSLSAGKAALVCLSFHHLGLELTTIWWITSKFLKTSMVPRGWILLTLVSPWLFLQVHQQFSIVVNTSTSSRVIDTELCADIHCFRQGAVAHLFLFLWANVLMSKC